MCRYLICMVLFFSVFSSLKGATIKGSAKDAKTGEELVGANIYIRELKRGTVSGLDGSYVIKEVPKGNYTISCSYISYQTFESKLSITENDIQVLNFGLSLSTEEIGQVTVIARKEQNTEISARSSERNSIQVLNVISAKAIELSPDLTVANVIQRMSGVTLERNATGDGQYAILRGMDKRFNYTMVNGMKIPSPDNKNRFVPLDIFPSELLDRLEVSKSLTANMEGDGIGGAVNMVMKDAPSNRQFTANLSTGYNTLFFNNKYQFFDVSAINAKSPNEKYGLAYPVQMKDFTTKNLHLNSKTAVPNLSGGFSFGDRFLKEKLGVILAGSYQKSERANSSDVYSTSTTNSNNQQDITNRFFSNEQTRLGLHAKFDMKLSANHKLMWYNAYMDFRNLQVRDAISYSSETTRMRWNRQTILNSTLKGFDDFNDSKLKLDWSLSYGNAMNETPDNVQINALIINGYTSIDQNDGASRRWEHNSDKDISGYANLLYSLKFATETALDLSAGGMYRDKVRGSYFNEYHFKPFDESKPNPREITKGVDYNNFDEIKFIVPSWNLSDPLNYGATEKIGAGYIMENLSIKNLQFVAGVRAEYTNQGYNLKFTTEGARNEGSQEYVDVLPSFNVKYLVHKDANLRISYAKAINRPSFFEIVPYSIIGDEYKERGNPDLRHTKAYNFDLRYEYFPRPSEQYMIGFFYKKIIDPIEFGFMSYNSQDLFYMPMNYGDANNYGVEVDVIKYFGWFGIKANYTYTNSDITTSKKKDIPNPDPKGETNIITLHVDQTRPLFGQAEHVANFSILFKDKRNIWDGQFSFSYTGDRLTIVSSYLNDDTWQGAYAQVDASVEKRFKSGLALFAKASNLLNSPMIQYKKRTDENALFANVERYHKGIVARKEFYGQNIIIGIRYKF
jgi:outer membrane receptor protein involved in Fe transport